MQQSGYDEIEINLKELFFFLLKKLWIMILSALIFALGAGLYSYFALTPMYTSSTKIYVINRQNKETTTISDLQSSAQLTQDYKILILSRPVTEQVITNLNLNMTHQELVSHIKVNTPQNTRILEIAVEHSNPEIAKQLADSIAEEFAERMVTIMEMEKANIIEPGNLPTDPSSPNKSKNILIGGVVGGLLPIIILTLLFIKNDTIKTAEDIERYLGLTTLGTIPLDDSINKENPKRNNNTSRHNIGFAVKEAYKTLRTNIQFSGRDIKTICVTSTLPNEGKTVVSLSLAKTIAESDKKVLFIDADLRKSVILNRLKVDKPVYGLSEYISGMNELEDVIYQSEFENVNIIFTGPLPPNPSEMLGSEEFKNILKILRDKYDYIIIDTPPLGVVIDSANVAKLCDGTIIVIESEVISYRMTQKVIKQLEKGKCRILGAVLNKKVIKLKGYYGKAYGKYYG